MKSVPLTSRYFLRSAFTLFLLLALLNPGKCEVRSTLCEARTTADEEQVCDSSRRRKGDEAACTCPKTQRSVPTDLSDVGSGNECQRNDVESFVELSGQWIATSRKLGRALFRNVQSEARRTLRSMPSRRQMGSRLRSASVSKAVQASRARFTERQTVRDAAEKATMALQGASHSVKESLQKVFLFLETSNVHLQLSVDAAYENFRKSDISRTALHVPTTICTKTRMMWNCAENRESLVRLRHNIRARYAKVSRQLSSVLRKARTKYAKDVLGRLRRVWAKNDLLQRLNVCMARGSRRVGLGVRNGCRQLSKKALNFRNYWRQRMWNNSSARQLLREWTFNGKRILLFTGDMLHAQRVRFTSAVTDKAKMWWQITARKAAAYQASVHEGASRAKSELKAISVQKWNVWRAHILSEAERLHVAVDNYATFFALQSYELFSGTQNALASSLLNIFDAMRTALWYLRILVYTTLFAAIAWAVTSMARTTSSVFTVFKIIFDSLMRLSWLFVAFIMYSVRMLKELLVSRAAPTGTERSSTIGDRKQVQPSVHRISYPPLAQAPRYSSRKNSGPDSTPTRRVNELRLIYESPPPSSNK